MSTGAMKGALGRPALIVGFAVMLLFAGQPPAATEWDPVGAQQRTLMQEQTDALTVPSHLVNVLMGYEDSPDDGRGRTWATIWIVQRWTFEPLLPLPEPADTGCTYCWRVLFEMVPVAFPYPKLSVPAGPDFVTVGTYNADIEAGFGSTAGIAVTFTPLDSSSAGSTRPRTSAQPPPPFYGIPAAAAVGLYTGRETYSDAAASAAMPLLRDPDADSSIATERLLDTVVSAGAVHEEPYSGCPGTAWAGPGCDFMHDAVTFNPPLQANALETQSIEEPARGVPEPGTLMLLGLGLLALGMSSLRAAPHGPGLSIC